MKKLLLFLLLSYTLFAKSPFHPIPITLQSAVCEKLAQESNRCDNGSTIDYYKHFQLANGDLLVFVYLNEHAITPGQSHSAVPLLVNSLGEWIIGTGEDIISEDIESIHQDPLQNIWVRALWQIEGVSPALYHSSDAIHWKRTILPQNREVNCCFETMDKPNFQLDTIKLTFRDLDNKVVKSWATRYQSAMSSEPQWHEVPTQGLPTLETYIAPNWSIEESKSHISFKNISSPYHFSLPRAENNIKKLYHIQIGAFKTMSSSNVVMKKLDNLPYPLFTKQMKVKGKNYIKLLMGDFTSLKKAKFMLSKIKKEHPNNKAIQEAFILSTKY